MTWLPAADALEDIQERRAARDDARQRQRVEHIRREALALRRSYGLGEDDESPEVWAPPAKVTWGAKVGEHRDGYYVHANPRNRGRLLWYSICSCGWHVARGHRLRESAQASWRNHLTKEGEAASPAAR